MGVLTWIVGLVRLVRRHNFAYLPPFPERMPKLQRSIAKANEYGLYALLFVQPITGLGRGLFGDRPFELLIWQVPVLEPNPIVRSLFAEAHELGANVLLALIGLHAGRRAFQPSGLARRRATTDVAAGLAVSPGARTLHRVNRMTWNKVGPLPVLHVRGVDPH